MVGLCDVGELSQFIETSAISVRSSVAWRAYDAMYNCIRFMKFALSVVIVVHYQGNAVLRRNATHRALVCATTFPIAEAWAKGSEGTGPQSPYQGASAQSEASSMRECGIHTGQGMGGGVHNPRTMHRAPRTMHRAGVAVGRRPPAPSEMCAYAGVAGAAQLPQPEGGARASLTEIAYHRSHTVCISNMPNAQMCYITFR